MDETTAVSASRTCTQRVANRFLGPSVIILPRSSTLPTRCSGSSFFAAFFPNSRSSMRILSSLISGSTGRSSTSALHGT